MSEATIRAAVYAAVNDVTGKGVVYDYERWAATWPAFLALFKVTEAGDGQIRGWEVAYRGFNAVRDPQFGRLTLREHNFWVQGYLRIDDSAGSEKTAAALAEDMCDAIDANTTIHSSPYRDASPASLEVFGPRDFGGVLCHYARIVVTVTEDL